MTRATDASKPARPTVSGYRLLVLVTAWLMAGSGYVAVASSETLAQGASSKEYQVKAACLLNFVQFIEFPAATFPRPETPVTIGVLGDDPFGAILEQTFQDELVHGRGLMVKRSRQLEELKTCHVLFVSKSEKHRLAETLASLSDANIVTVGETEGFAQRGGIINFYIDGGKIRFEINAQAAQPKGIRIGSQLLKRARIVGSDPRKGRE